MLEAGIISQDDRVELLEGEILKMSPIGSAHAACVKRCNSVLSRLLGETVIISVQDPVRLDEYSEPQPDIALLKARPDYYAVVHPSPGDVLLVVEVADTSLQIDRVVKLPLYARAGITEVWIIDLVTRAVEIYSDPNQGVYRNSHTVRGDEPLSPAKLPSLSIPASALLG